MADDITRRLAAHEDRMTAQDEHAVAADSRSDGQDTRSDGQDVRADDRERTDAEWRVAADTRSDWQDQINKNRYRKLGRTLRSLALGCCVALLCLAVALPFAVRAATNANRAAKTADKAAACSSLLLNSLADQKIDPQATRLGCNTDIANRLIARGKARDAAVRQTQEQVRMDACGLLTLLPGAATSPQVARFRADFGCV